MYRAVAWKANHDGIDLENGSAVAAVASHASFEVNDKVVIDGHDVTDAIRTPAIDQAAAIVAQHQPVRAVLVERQRRYASGGGIVMEGRDIGSVVFPDADVKVYLDAAPGERARRRSADAAHAAGRAIGSDGVAEALEVRDRIDRTRIVSPLKMASDAVYLDTTNLGVGEVVDNGSWHWWRRKTSSKLKPEVAGASRQEESVRTLTSSFEVRTLPTCRAASRLTRPGRAPSDGGRARRPCRLPRSSSSSSYITPRALPMSSTRS